MPTLLSHKRKFSGEKETHQSGADKLMWKHLKVVKEDTKTSQHKGTVADAAEPERKKVRFNEIIRDKNIANAMIEKGVLVS